MLVRDKRALGGIEVFMVRRSARSPFAPDAVVFPGGALDPADDGLAAAAVRELEEEAGVRLVPEALIRFSHWITPPNEARRYDTHFYLAAAPDDQDAVADEHETHEGRWLDPGEALRHYREGSLRLVYPTVKHLERLTAFASVDALLAFARTKPVITVAPHASPDAGYVMPAELEGAW
jgi:8-oxo-dGTP pyrophosphatase MutT (NUDIX family)